MLVVERNQNGQCFLVPRTCQLLSMIPLGESLISSQRHGVVISFQLPPLPALNIPRIELADFLRYLKETTTGRKVHRAVIRQLKREQQSEDSLEPLSPLAIAPPISLLKQEGRTFDLSSVPRIFMQADFSLADAPTFQEVLPLSQLLPKKKKQSVKTPEKPRNSGSTGGHQSAKLLHEKLTHSLDIIEVHLAYHIAQRSDMFFSTLSSQQELQTHIMQVQHEVVELR